ncbi:MAG: hypothetical protein IT198_04925 [Acidimicrobiia bacterium]|nr:hypothetical protein [Acidimicrobiia bacterium]
MNANPRDTPGRHDSGAAMIIVIMIMLILSVSMVTVGGLVITYFQAADSTTGMEDVGFDADEAVQRTVAAILNLVVNPASAGIELPAGTCDSGDTHTFTLPVKQSAIGAAAFDVDDAGGEDKEDPASGHKNWVRIDCVELDENPVLPLPVLDDSIVLFSREPEAFAKAGREPVRVGRSVRMNRQICQRDFVVNGVLDYELADGCLDPANPATEDLASDVIFVSDDTTYPGVEISSENPGVDSTWPAMVNRALPWNTACDPVATPCVGPVGVQARRLDAAGQEIQIDMSPPVSIVPGPWLDPGSELGNVWPQYSPLPLLDWDPAGTWGTDFLTGDPAAPFRMPQDIKTLDPPTDLPRIDESTCRLVTYPDSLMRVNDIAPADWNYWHRLAGFGVNTTPVWDCVRRWKPGNYAGMDVSPAGADLDGDGTMEAAVDPGVAGLDLNPGTPGTTGDLKPFLSAWQDVFGIDWEDDGNVDVPGSWEPDLGQAPLNPLCPALGNHGYVLWLVLVPMCFTSQQFFGPHARVHIRANVFEPGVYYFADNLVVDAGAYEDRVDEYLSGPFRDECVAQYGSLELCVWIANQFLNFTNYLTGEGSHPPAKKSFHAPVIAGTPPPPGANPQGWDPTACEPTEPGTMFTFAEGKGLHQGVDQINPPPAVAVCGLTEEQVANPSGAAGGAGLATMQADRDQGFGGVPGTGFADGSLTRDVALFQLPFPIPFWITELGGNPPTDPANDSVGWALHAARNTIHGGPLSLDGIVYSPHGRVGVSSTYLFGNGVSVGSGLVAHSLLVISRYPGGDVFSDGLPEAMRRIRFFVRNCQPGDPDCPLLSQVLPPLDPDPGVIDDFAFLFDDLGVLPGDPPIPQNVPPNIYVNFPTPMRDPDVVVDVTTLSDNTARVDRWIRGNPTE